MQSPMSRSTIALLIGLVGIAGYLILVLALGDFALEWHWIWQLLYFGLAGIVWVWPAKWLIYWGAGK
jgi:hypothetical protein